MFYKKPDWVKTRFSASALFDEKKRSLNVLRAAVIAITLLDTLFYSPIKFKTMAKASKAAPRKAAKSASKKAVKKAAPKKAAPKKATKKAAPKKAVKKAAPAKKRKINPALLKPLTPSQALADVIGSKPASRPDIIKKVWDYIKKQGLQDSKNKRMINADDKLKVLFAGKSQVSMFDLAKIVSANVK